ncbi:MAG: mechanosensitive ion channel [Pseudomonas sp.]|nr:MAG: mechanosensitive ion channel [Pseudomonas sp.]
MSTVNEGQEKAAKLINDLQDISFTKIGIIIAGTWLIITLAHRVLPYLAEKGPSQLRLYLLGAVPIIRLVLLVIAILWVIPIVFNITFQNFLVISGAASVAIGFAFKDYVSSLIAGIVAIVERPYRPGDWVEIDGDYGEVRAVGMRSIEVRTPADNIVYIPHEKIWQNNISNSNDGARTLMCVTSFYLKPEHDAQAVRTALRDVALTSAYLDYARPVLVMLEQTTLGTHYKVKAYPFDMRDQFSFVSDLTIRGKLAVAETGASESAPMADISF